MAEALFGDVNPGAKLPVTVARDVAQVPLYYNARPAPRRLDPDPDEPVPLFPFGFGLSYTTFELGAPRLSAKSIPRRRTRDRRSRRAQHRVSARATKSCRSTSTTSWPRSRGP